MTSFLHIFQKYQKIVHWDASSDKHTVDFEYYTYLLFYLFLFYCLLLFFVYLFYVFQRFNFDLQVYKRLRSDLNGKPKDLKYTFLSNDAFHHSIFVPGSLELLLSEAASRNP